MGFPVTATPTPSRATLTTSPVVTLHNPSAPEFALIQLARDIYNIQELDGIIKDLETLKAKMSGSNEGGSESFPDAPAGKQARYGAYLRAA